MSEERAKAIEDAKRRLAIQEAKKRLAAGNQVVEEMHPDVSAWDRFLAKNFSSNSGEAFNYLQRKHPNLEWKKNDAGRFLMRDRGSDRWNVLDPDGEGIDALQGWEGFKESIMDTTDLVTDVGAALGETAASATAGLAATAPTGGAGTIPAAMGAGGASAYGLEGLRQGIGQLAGVNKEGFDHDLLNLSGAFGTAAPLVFGSSVGANQVARHFARQGLTGEALKNAVEQTMKSQSGLVGKGWRGIKSTFPTVAQGLSSVPKKIISAGNEQLDKLKKAAQVAKDEKKAITLAEQAAMTGGAEEKATLKSLKDSESSALLDIYNTLSYQFKEAWEKYKKNKTDEFGLAKDSVSGTVPVTDLFAPMRNVVSDYTQRLEGVRRDLLEKYPPPLPTKDPVKTQQAMTRHSQKIDRMLKKTAEWDDYKAVHKAWDKHKPITGEMSAKRALEKQNTLNDFTGIRKNMNVGKKDAADSAMINATRVTAGNLREAVTSMPENSHFKAVSSDWAKFGDEKELFKKQFSSPAKVSSTVKSYLGTGGNDVEKRAGGDFARKLGVNLEDSVTDAGVLKHFQKPQLLPGGDLTPVGSKTIPAAGLGLSAGAYLGSQGENGPGPWIGGGLGAIAATGLLGPRGLRFMMNQNRNANRLGRAVQEMGPLRQSNIPAAANIWENIDRNDR